MAFNAKRKKNANSNATKTGSKPVIQTGNNDFDDTRFKPRGLNEKTKRADVRASAGGTISSLSDALLAFFISPVTGKTIATAGMISSVLLGGVMYANFIFEQEGWTMGLNIPYSIGLVVAIGITIVQLLPRLHIYFPELASRMTAKLGMTIYTSPNSLQGSPTLLDEAKTWAPTAHENAFKAAFVVSSLLYVFELLGAFNQFTPVVNNRIVFSQVLGIIWAVGGSEISLILRTFLDGYCLNRRQSRIFATQQLRERVAGEQNYMGTTTKPDIQVN
jgi:hypothetical protein